MSPSAPEGTAMTGEAQLLLGSVSLSAPFFLAALPSLRCVCYQRCFSKHLHTCDASLPSALSCV